VILGVPPLCHNVQLGFIVKARTIIILSDFENAVFAGEIELFGAFLRREEIRGPRRLPCGF
jgi:hypothetical protein